MPGIAGCSWSVGWDGYYLMDGADPVDRLYGFVGLGPADRRFISRMHLRLKVPPLPPRYSHST